jgi:hypothetical protein
MSGLPNQTIATQAVYRAVQDLKAAVRYFRKDAATANLFHIDPTMIFTGGSSAGAFTVLHLAYLDQPAELPAAIDTAVLGGLEGNSGNPGYPSTVNAIVNLCGAVGDTSWIVAGDIPVCSMHGTADNIVPYATSMLSVLSIPIMVVNGSHSVSEQARRVGIPNVMYTFFGASHVPYANNTVYMDTTVRFVSNFLYSYMGCTPTDPTPLPNTFLSVSVQQINFADNSVLIYPNPSSENVHIRLPGGFNNCTLGLLDLSGRIIFESAGESKEEITLERKNIAAGMYLLKVNSNGTEIIRKICFE